MPTYPDLTPCDYYPNPELFFRRILAPLDVTSILDVGAGHGGVFDYGYWTAKSITRAACDLTWMRAMDPAWECRTGVDVQRLVEAYGAKSFDLVQCMEVLEHVPNPRLALEQLVAVARKAVIITSADETQHEGPEQEAIEKVNPGQRYLAQPRVEDLLDLGFEVRVERAHRRQLVAWRIAPDSIEP